MPQKDKKEQKESNDMMKIIKGILFLAAIMLFSLAWQISGHEGQLIPIILVIVLIILMGYFVYMMNKSVNELNRLIKEK